mgnify:CR=1 FL=1
MQEKILLVEDDRDIVAYLSSFLKNENFIVEAVAGQREAIEKLETREYDLLLIDISLADGNGYAVCAAAKEKSPAAVIFLTASGDEYSVVTGLDIVRICYEEGIPVTSLPGAAACITALTMSGLPTRRFAFEAFLPKDKKEHQAVLEELKTETRTIIIYEAPHHLVRTLQELSDTLGGERRLTICRELTKRHEEKLQMTLADSLSYYEVNEPRGEYVLIIAGRSREEMKKEEQAGWEALSLEEHMAHYESQGIDRKEAMKRVAKDRGVSKRDIYQALLK